eukprot:2793917-Rhodomonas_salina.1
MTSKGTTNKSVEELDPCHCGGLCVCCSDTEAFCEACFLPFMTYGQAVTGSEQPRQYVCFSALYAAQHRRLLGFAVLRDELKVDLTEVDLGHAFAVPVLDLPNEVHDARTERVCVVDPVQAQH